MKHRGRRKPWAAILMMILLVAGGGIWAVLYFSSDRPKPSVRAEQGDEREESHTPLIPAKPKSHLVVLPKDKQASVERAVARGVEYLRKEQLPEGNWDFARSKKYRTRHATGLAAMPGLTLLSCGVSPKDPAVQNAAQFVRSHGKDLVQTYDISLAILFLTRLGEAKDRPLLQTLTLRLVAGQTSNGGWSYKCPKLVGQQPQLLLSALQQLPRLSKKDVLGSPLNQRDPGSKLVASKPADMENPDDATKLVLDSPKTISTKLALAIDSLPPRLRTIPVFQLKPSPTKAARRQRSDNSNTQFAVLALWAARKQVPLDRTLALIVKRFRTSQLATGGWWYGYRNMVGVKRTDLVGTATMTCAGLLGLAIGYGLSQDDIKAQGGLNDPSIELALRALAVSIEQSRLRSAKPRRRYNMYFLWSVERVAMLYRLRKIGKNDWYNWGVDLLLASQSIDDGSWCCNTYAGSDPVVDSCLALLFLNRVNLVADLSDKLPLDLKAVR